MKELKNTFFAFHKTKKLILDKKTPIAYKLIPAGALAYIIFPFDFIADFIPALGQIDDLAILLGSVHFFNSLAESKIKG